MNCKCGHYWAAHKQEHLPHANKALNGGCLATIHMSNYSFPCQCTQFEAAHE